MSFSLVCDVGAHHVACCRVLHSLGLACTAAEAQQPVVKQQLTFSVLQPAAIGSLKGRNAALRVAGMLCRCWPPAVAIGTSHAQLTCGARCVELEQGCFCWHPYHRGLQQQGDEII
jgi:hypothetical protein